jgi:hypothetical protein
MIFLSGRKAFWMQVENKRVIGEEKLKIKKDDNESFKKSNLYIKLKEI